MNAVTAEHRRIYRRNDDEDILIFKKAIKRNNLLGKSALI